MILHPSGLESGILAVVAEDQQPRPFGMMDHVLGQHVDIRHVGGAHGAGRLAVGAAEAPAVGTARQATGQVAGVVLPLPDRVEDDRLSGRTAVEATGDTFGMGGSASTAEMERGGSLVPFEVLVIAVADDAMNRTTRLPPRASSSGTQHEPDPAASPPPGFRPVELEAAEEGDEVVLSAGGARGDRKVGMPVIFPTRLDLVLGCQPKPGPRVTFREADHRPADAPDEAVHHRTKQRTSFAAGGGAQGRPGQDFGFGHRAAHGPLEERWQITQRHRARQASLIWYTSSLPESAR